MTPEQVAERIEQIRTRAGDGYCQLRDTDWLLSQLDRERRIGAAAKEAFDYLRLVRRLTTQFPVVLHNALCHYDAAQAQPLPAPKTGGGA